MSRKVSTTFLWLALAVGFFVSTATANEQYDEEHLESAKTIYDRVADKLHSRYGMEETSFLSDYFKLHAEDEESKKELQKTISELANPVNWVKAAASSSDADHEKPWFPERMGEIDPECLTDKDKWYYRTFDGSCNWMRKGEAKLGTAGSPYARDRPAHFKDGTDGEPREGPNPREVSNMFFNNERTSFWDHSFFLPAWVEFLIHDLMLSSSGHNKADGDIMDIPVPKCDVFFDPNCTGTEKMKFWRTKSVPGTGKDGKTREFVNDQTIWIDLSSIYGVSEQINQKLRTGVDGKMKIEDGQYLPLNNEHYHPWFPMVGKSWKDTFVAGDVRANQDWALMALHALFTLEHNRLCDVLKELNPDWDDHRLFQTARVALTAKMSMAGAAYFLAYYTDMPLASPLSVYEQWHKKFVSPFMRYPWKDILNPETDTPFALPNEFSIGYRWHVLIPPYFTLVDEKNVPYKTVSVPDTAFNGTLFKEAGLENVLRGMAVTTIPDFHSGTQDVYRNMKVDFHDPQEGTNFDITTWAIMHERSRGLPTYNEYMKGYTGKVPVKPKKTFEDFTSNPKFVAELKRLYKTPDDVDLIVGQELDEEWWPHTHIPLSMLLINFYTLFRASVSDRFTLSYNLAHCILEQRPWDCKTNNALQDLLWKPIPGLWKNAKMLDLFWIEELDLKDQGANILHKMIVKNTGIKCLQKNVFFLPNEKTNPIICYSLDAMPTANSRIFKNVDLEFLSYGLTDTTKFNHWADKYGDVVHYTVSRGGEFALFSTAQDVNHIYSSWKFTERVPVPYFDFTYGRVAGMPKPFEVTSPTLTNSAGYTWRLLRGFFDQTVRPTFNKYMPEFNNYAKQLVKVFAGHKEQQFNPYNDIRYYSFEVMAHACWGRENVNRDPARKQKLYDAVIYWLDDFPKWMIFGKPWPVIMAYPQYKLGKHMDVVGAFESDILREKRTSGNYGDDWLGLLANAEVNGTRLPDEWVKSVVFEIMEANAGPIASLLNYAMYLLGSSPQMTERLRTDLLKMVGHRDLTVQDFHNHPLLWNIGKESARLYPGGYNIRVSTEQDVVAGYQIPYSTNMVINTLRIHRDPRYWKNPEEFNPYRWETDHYYPGAWTTFGDGPRDCPGRNFALMQASVAISHIVRNYHIEYFGEPVPKLDFGLVGMFKTPINIKLTPINYPKDEL